MNAATLLITVLLYSLGANSSQAQNREVLDQTPHDQAERVQPITVFSKPGEIPKFSDILKNVHGQYSVSFMGPKFEGDSNSTYNIYLPDTSSIQFYHSAKLGYQVNEDLQIGVEENVVQNLADGVVGDTGLIYNKTFEFYDPNIYFNLPNLIKIPGWWVGTTASFSLPISTPSQNAAKITSIIVDQSWSVNTYPSKWSYGFHLYLNPQFYNEPIPVGFANRQTLAFTFGHNLGYQASPLVYLSTSSNFDVEHRSPDPKGFAHLGDALPDYMQFSISITPNIYPSYMSIGGYMQMLIWSPSWATSIVGAKFSIGF